MDALLVGGGLAVGGWLLKADSKKTNKETSLASTSIYESRIIDARSLDRKTYEKSLPQTNISEANGIKSGYFERPSSGRNENQRTGSVITGSTRSLTGDMMLDKEYTHNNMVPFFGSKVRQNVNPEASSTILETFTGVSGLQRAKEEVDSMFSLQQSDTNGTPGITEGMKSRFIPSRYQQNVPITEPIIVGPGLNKGYSSTPSGGYHSFDTARYAQTKTVDEMRVKTNPKVSYEARVTSGFKGSRRGMEQVLTQNRVVRFHNYDESPRMNTTVVTSSEMSRGNYDDKITNRQGTLHSYTAPAGPSLVKLPISQENFKTQTASRQSLENFGFRNSHTKIEPKLNIQYCSDVRRDDSVSTSYMGQIASVVQKIIAPIQDVIRPTIKETQIEDARNYGNFGSIRKNAQVYDASDTTRTTIKETTINGTRSGDVGISDKRSYAYDPNDITRTTIKELGIDNKRDAAIGVTSYQSTTYDPNDITRTTIKELGIDNRRDAAIGVTSYQSTTYDPNDITRTTIKELSINETHDGFMGANVQHHTLVNPDEIARTTTKELGIHDTRKGFIGPTIQKSATYDPNDVTRSTIKETLIHDTRIGQLRQFKDVGHVANPMPFKVTARDTLKQYLGTTNVQGPLKNGNVNGRCPVRTTIKQTIKEDNRKGIALANKGQSYITNPMYAPPTNKQQTSNSDYSGQAMGHQDGAYKITIANAPNTTRQVTSDYSYSGVANGTSKPVSYEDVYNATLNEYKEIISKERPPTTTGPKVGKSTNEIGNMEMKESLENRETLTVTPFQNNPLDARSIHLTNEKCDLETQNRINPENLRAFNDNPLTQSLHSSA
jgi:hypothetical protein